MRLKHLLFYVFLLVAPMTLVADECTNPAILVTVGDPNGNFVRGLGPQHLKAKVAGHELPIDSVAQATVPVRVLLLIDQGVIGDGEKWPAAHDALTNLLKFARADTSFALDIFGRGPEEKILFGQPREAILKALDEAAAQSRHAGKIMDGIQQSLAFFGNHQQGDVVYVITDGLDDASHIRADPLTKLVVQSGVRIFAMYFREARFGSGAGVLVAGKGAPQVRPWDDIPADSIGLVDEIQQTGGGVVNALPAIASHRFELVGKNLEDFQRAAALNYREMTQYYVVRLKGKASLGSAIDLSFAEPKLSALKLGFPKKLGICDAK